LKSKNGDGFRRKLPGILSADFQGYSRLMGSNEDATIRTLTTCQWPFS